MEFKSGQLKVREKAKKITEMLRKSCGICLVGERLYFSSDN